MFAKQQLLRALANAPCVCVCVCGVWCGVVLCVVVCSYGRVKAKDLGTKSDPNSTTNLTNDSNAITSGGKSLQSQLIRKLQGLQSSVSPQVVREEEKEGEGEEEGEGGQNEALASVPLSCASKPGYWNCLQPRRKTQYWPYIQSLPCTTDGNG